jgi:putative addiction module component (TIGR02574 family)
MPMTIEQILAETRQLPDDVVAELVDRIQLGRHGIDDDLVLNESMQTEIRRRVDDIRSGKEKGIPGEVVSARIRKIVGR